MRSITVFVVRWISTMALIIAKAMNHYAVEVVTFGARCAEVQVIGHFIDSKDP